MKVKEYPFYIKAAFIILGLVLTVFCLFILKGILTPFAFAIVISILLNPLVNRLRNYKINRVLAIIISMLLALLVIAGIFYFLSSQIIKFGENFTALKERLYEVLHHLQQWIQNNFGIAVEKQVKMLNDALQSSQALLGKTVGSALGTLTVIFLLPVYVFMLLFYKTLILNFIYEVFAEENSRQVKEILNQTKTAIQSYMLGLLIEAGVVAVLNSTALLILGVQYAILLGVIGAILNMLPYIGGIIAIALPVLVATLTQDGYSTQFGIIIAYAIIQFIDNNFLIPKIVSSKVQINALFSILIVLLGGALWGIAGMFLSIPFLAILKIIFDRIEELKPWGRLLGDEIPTRHKGQIWKRRTKKLSLAEKIVEESDEVI